MATEIWRPVSQPGSLSERIVAQIEKHLLDQQLRTGDRLPPEREMAQMLGVSRPSLREAVRVLEARGRLTVRHGQGVFVTEHPAQRGLRAAMGETELNVNELFGMREVLEVPAAGWAAERVTQEQIAELQAMLEELDRTFELPDPDFDRLATLDAAFHLSIAEIAGNRFLRQTSHVLHDILLSGMETTLLLPGRRQKSRREHARILRALAAGDGSAARSAARAHIRSAQGAALARMDGQATQPVP